MRQEIEQDAGRAPRMEKLDEALREVTRVADTCMKAALTADGPERERLARVALRFDSQHDGANEHLEHIRLEGGRWASPELAALLARRREIAGGLAEARVLPVTLTPRQASDPALLEVLGTASAVEHEGLVFESHLPVETLVETVKAVVRAMALANWLMTGRMEPLHQPGKIIHLPRERYAEFLSRVSAAGRADPRSPSIDPGKLFAYITVPTEAGAGTSYAVATACMRGSLGPFVLVLYDRSLADWNWNTWYENDPVVPFWLVVGHLNLVSLMFLGARPPDFELWVGEGATSASGVQPRFTAGEAGLVGCRSYLRDLARERADPPFSSCVLNQFSKLTGEKRLKAISLVEHLHETSSVEEFVKSYRTLKGEESGGTEAGRSPQERAEHVLERTLPELDEEWRTWLLGPEGSSVRDALDGLRSSGSVDTSTMKMLEHLNRSRAAAGLSPVVLDAELSRGAAEHARYLLSSPERANRWPDAHEEEMDSEGFTPAGAWAGMNSVISQVGPEACIDDWLATFYHRLPLLHPGLLRVGFGYAKNICVLDAGSLVSPGTQWEVGWPVDGQQGVPRTFPGELPPPVPERARPNELGYPITFQVGPLVSTKDFQISLFDSAGEEVPCWLSTPDAPSNPLLVPDQSWCLIPEKPLAPGKKYGVRAQLAGAVREWSFQTAR